ncbi:unnamed protein product [Schistosoma turkestanicum]|nr:unnamed protein product [Schistosoma turkestanicum]
MSNSWLLVTVTALLAVFVQSDEISFIFDEEIRNQLYYPQCYHTDQVVEENAGTPKPEAPVVPVADQTGDKKTAAETNIQPVDSIDASSGPRQRRNGGRNNGGQRRNGGRNNGVSPINNGVESNNVVS